MTRLIDADALLAEFAKLRNKFHSDEDYQDAMMFINFAPTVHGDDPSPWIPVSERLPEEGRVLTARWNEIHYSRFRLGKFLIDVEPLTYRETYPTHWIPIPKPPTE